MNEHPILFSTGMVKVIREGRKTQTRRIIKPQPDKDSIPTLMTQGGCVGFQEYFGHLNMPMWCCPYGKPGDHLWVRETWQRCPECGRVVYKASSNQNGKVCPNCDEWLGTWKPSIHMFREYSRITLEVVNVRVERLQDITEAGARAEGAEAEKSHRVYPSSQAAWVSTYRSGFQTLWNHINESGFGWDTNPWVWVVEFKRILTRPML